jgi:hypothetical protein
MLVWSAVPAEPPCVAAVALGVMLLSSGVVLVNNMGVAVVDAVVAAVIIDAPLPLASGALEAELVFVERGSPGGS